MNNNQEYEIDIRKVEQAMVIDLYDYVPLLSNKLLEALVDAPAGIYLPNRLTPIIDLSFHCFFESDFKDNNLTNRIIDANTILEKKETIVDLKGIPLLTEKQINANLNYLVAVPTMPVMAMKMCHAVIINYLSTITRHTTTGNRRIDLEELVKPEFYYLVRDGEYESMLVPLINIVVDFVKSDVWNIYYERIVGTSLIIEKSLDSRIVEYYQLLEENKELKQQLAEYKHR